jgi:hypothetical protein
VSAVMEDVIGWEIHLIWVTSTSREGGFAVEDPVVWLLSLCASLVAAV